MSTSDGDGLRAAIVAQPDDDTLRLIYADWLQENDQSDRAAFVRAQISFAQSEPFSPEARQHGATAKKLLKSHLEWGRSVQQKHGALKGRFVRGFVEHVNVDASVFPRHAAELFAAEPIRSLQVTRFASDIGPPVPLEPILQLPELDRVTRLDLSGVHLAPDEFELLSSAPEIVNLTDLCLRQNTVLPDWIAGVLAGFALPSLTGLDVYGLSHLGPRLAAAFPRANRRPLRRLDLGQIRFESVEMKAVLDSRCLREVEELRLAWVPGFKGPLTELDLGWTIPWDRLRLLDLSGQGIGNQGVKDIVNALKNRREPSPLRWLGLANNGIGADGVRELVESNPEKVKLYYLEVGGNALNRSLRGALEKRFPEAVIKYDL